MKEGLRKTPALLVCALLFTGVSFHVVSAAPPAAPRPISARGPLLSDETATIKLFKKSMKSVVYITTLILRQNIFTLNATEIPKGSGSGFIWDAEGHIVTNYHVIQGADAAKITLADGKTYDAVLIGGAPDKDIAVLKIKAPTSELQPLDLGTSHDLSVGQKVLAIGNPFGLDQTLTTGVISALGREIQSITRRPITGVIQTDAAINPGNSGGPLLDSAGRLIGVNTLIYSPSGAYAGVGFSVPVDTVNRIVPQLISYGKVVRPGLGIIPAPDHIAERFRVAGVPIVNVERRSGADKAKLRGMTRSREGYVILGDVITGIDDHKIAELNDLFKALDTREVGDTVTVTYLREGRSRRVRLQLQALD